MLTLERLKELLSYDHETGEFRLLVRRGNIPRGTVAGSVVEVRGKRYVRIEIEHRRYYAHRLAWFYVHGAWPSDQIDHIDNDGTNNSIANLREATNAQNQRNKRAYRNSKSRVKGVTYRPNQQKFRATIRQDGRCKHLGYFDSLEEARAAYLDAAKRLHGEFAKI